MAELRPAHLTELFLSTFPAFLYLPGLVINALDPSFCCPGLLATSIEWPA